MNAPARVESYEERSVSTYAPPAVHVQLPPLSTQARFALRRLRAALAPAGAPENEWRAVREWLGTFYPYQLEWLLDWGRFALLNKSRQIGASHTYAAAAVLWGMLGETTTVVSTGSREAAEVVSKANLHARALVELGSVWAEPVARSTREVRLRSGGRILALPATSGGRGYAGNAILDEFAYHMRPERVWDGAAAVVMHGYKLRVLSTPNGVGNLWHTLVTDERAHDGYRIHAVSVDTARRQGLRVDEAECWRMARGNPRVYDQLFRGSFIDNDAQYIPSALIDGSVHANLYAQDVRVYAGLDLGRTNDLTALVLIAVCVHTGMVYVRRVETRSRTAYTDVELLMELAFEQGAERVCIDATGLGAFPAEQLQKEYGRNVVEPVVFTHQSKEQLATQMYLAFASDTVRMHAGHGELRDDLRAIRRIVRPSGLVVYDAPRTERGHADRAWALALALRASGRDFGKYVVRELHPDERAAGYAAAAPANEAEVWGEAAE